MRSIRRCVGPDHEPARHPPSQGAIRNPRRRLHRGRRHRSGRRCERGARHRRRIGLGQIGRHARGHGPAALDRDRERRPHGIRRPRFAQPERRRTPPDRRPRHRDDFSRADVVLEPLLHRRLPDRRSLAHASGHGARGAQSTHARIAAPGRHHRSRAPHRGLSASTLGRHVPARDDRDGARLWPQIADCR